MASVNRRQFMGSAAGAAALSIVPRSAWGWRGQKPPSETLNIAGIGVGGQGGGDMRNVESENIVALCDVDWRHAAGTFKRYPNARRYRDFRVMLEKEKDIDAVVVATPDHVHAVAAMAAIKMGKHVYVEKPMAHSVFEVRRMTEAARDAGVMTQMGNQGHAEESMRLLKEWLDDGAIGTVREVEAWTPHAVWPQGINRPTDTPAVPDTLSWDLWLGPAAERPYHPAYLPAMWRGWWDFGTGALGDMGCHIFDPIYYALELGHPSSVEASYSTFVPHGLNWDKPFNNESYPRASIVRYRFPARGSRPALKMTWYDGGLMPERPDELAAGLQMGSKYGGVLFIGEKGKIICGAHGASGVRILPESLMKAYKRPDKRLPRSIGHHKEWIAACKGGPRPGSNFEYAGPMSEAVLLGNIAIRSGKRLDWDPTQMKITNVPEANAWLKSD
ncbi:MAG: Gfo/Idh/MocA family oxidoreductase, partial [Planctomycetes bacterium]|nr:Gfo/Idh/MocA family oxidoreductase [Planctomycetota bacterium]